MTPYLKEAKTPILNVAGWWDQEDFYGPLKIYETIEKFDQEHRNYLVVGPWNHGGWGRGTGRSLGKIDFASDTGKYFREKIQAPWFAYWLKDKGTPDLPEALTFQTGSNKWERYGAWPPREGVEHKKIYFQDAGELSFDEPRGEDGF
ncbi:MAG: CocE/NonD family hydrolase, partial [Bryobacteraceae bacterium]